MKLKQKIVKQIDNFEIQKKSRHHPPTPPPTDLKKEIEKAAMNCIICYYKDMNYNVTDVSKKNFGWDLEAQRGKHIVRIEVKGLSGNIISVDLTKNEYTQLRQYKEKGYRLAIVTNALYHSYT